MIGALEIGDIVLLDSGVRLILDIWKEEHWILKTLSLTYGLVEEVDIEEELMMGFPLKLIVKGTSV
jgi:hypothetical protein